MNSNHNIVDRLRARSFRGVIFDFDGTLLDVKKPLENAIEESFREKDIQFEMESTIQEVGSVLESVQGYPMPKILLQSYEIFKYITALKDLTFLKKLRIAIKVFSKFQGYSKEAELFPGTKQLISFLNKTCKLFIVSHNQTKNIVEILQREGIIDYFDGVYGADKLPALKPDPKALQPPLQNYKNLKLNDWLLIGDMPTDIEAAQEAGLHTIAVASGISKKEVLADWVPDLLIESLIELLNLIGIETGPISDSKVKNLLKVKS